MGNLSIEIPDEECVKLLRYEDGDGVAAYLLLFPEHDMKAVKPRIDAQLDHETAMSSVKASDALSRGVVDRPPQRVGRVDVDGVRAGALDGSFDGHDRIVPGRFHQILLKARSILSLGKLHMNRFAGSGAERESVTHNSSPNYSARTSEMRDDTDFRRGPGGSPNAARHYTRTKEVRDGNSSR